MDQFIQYLIYFHIAGGTIALITGPFSISNRKGGHWHRITGKLFFYAMLVVTISSVIVAFAPGHRNFFLFLMGIFSGYLILSGYRILYLKKLIKGQRPRFYDCLLSIGMAFTAAVLLGSGIMKLASGDASRAIISIAFAMLAALLVKMDFTNFIRRPKEKNYWLYQHIIRMIAATITAYTAFLVVNNSFLPPVLAWLGPTLLGIPLIRYFTNSFRKRMVGGKEIAEVATVKINTGE